METGVGSPGLVTALLGGGMHRAHRGSLLPTALGDPGDKRVAGASPRVARGRRERAGLGGARPSSSSPLAFASPGPSRATTLTSRNSNRQETFIQKFVAYKTYAKESLKKKDTEGLVLAKFCLHKKKI